MQVQGVQPSRGPAEDRRRGPRAAEVTRRPLGKRLRTFDRVLAAPSGFESQQRGAFPAVSGAKEVPERPLAGAIPVIALASAPTINNNPAEAGSVYNGVWRNVRHPRRPLDTIRAVRGAPLSAPRVSSLPLRF